MSSTKVLALVHFQPTLSKASQSAAAGPAALLQLFLHPSFALACWEAASIVSLGTQSSQCAVAQCRTGSVCAANVGSKVPLRPSSAYNVFKGFFPPPSGAASLAIVDTCCERSVLDTPWMSAPYVMDAVPAILAMSLMLTPCSLNAYIFSHKFAFSAAWFSKLSRISCRLLLCQFPAVWPTQLA